VEDRLDLRDCTQLTSLPAGLKVGRLVLQGCTALTALPAGLDVGVLNIQGCPQLTDWPEPTVVRGALNARGCVKLRGLPSGLKRLSYLDVCGCTRLRQLPDGLRISSWIDFGDTAITRLPASLTGVRPFWRGVDIDARIAFHPETITVHEILHEWNVERRRVLLERVDLAWFLSHAGARVLDVDRDAGGERRLLLVSMPGDEDLVCVSVRCPSTRKRHVLRVPPRMRTCRQAVAWTAGFKVPEQYRPVVES
jgi:hypothetical protein